MSGEQAESVSSSNSDVSENLEGAIGGVVVEKMESHTNSEATAPGTSEPRQASGSGDPATAGKMATTVDVNYERVVQERKNQIMFELRRLQHGDRPVTGQGNREAVSDFFSRALAHPEEQVSNPEESRPEAVTVEVNALVERRPVSSLLYSMGFRRRLETVLMGAIGNVQGRSSPATSRNSPAASRAPSDSGTSPGAAEQRRASPSSSPARPTPRAREMRRRPHPGAAAISQHLANRAAAAQQRQQRQQPQASSQQAPAFIPPPPPPMEGPALAQMWVEQQPDPQPEVIEELRTVNVWETLEQSQREDLVNDITELVQRELVTSALDGEFRPVLENQMRERLQNTSTDGRRVQRFVQSLPNSGIRRNDFSHLGINETFDNSISDEMSVISATAAVTVNNQNNAATQREIRSLKGQMQELRNMMRLSFDLQLDIQRSIRQEVAAALTQALACAPVSSANGEASQPQGAATAMPVANKPVDDDNCLICLDGRADSVLYQCGHMCVCHPCGLQLKARGSNCPVCRAPIRDIIRAYRSTQNTD